MQIFADQFLLEIWHFNIKNISYDLEKKIGEGEDNGNTYIHISEKLSKVCLEGVKY